MGDPGSSLVHDLPWVSLSLATGIRRQYQDLDRWREGVATSFPQSAELVRVGTAESWNS